MVAVRVSQEEEFGLDCVRKPVDVLGVSEDSLKPELDGYLVWAVDFQLGIEIGEDVWAINPADGVSVVEISIGDLSSVGIDHSMAPGEAEPSAVDNVGLPEQPKG